MGSRYGADGSRCGGRAVSDQELLHGSVMRYVVPASLADLQGPDTGLVTLPARLRSGPQRTFDLDAPGQAHSAYQTVIQRGSLEDQVRLLNERVLTRAWPTLILPVRCRDLWKSRFPELAARPWRLGTGLH